MTSNMISYLFTWWSMPDSPVMVPGCKLSSRLFTLVLPTVKEKNRNGFFSIKRKEFASGLTSSLVEKNLTSKSLQVHKKVSFRGIRGSGGCDFNWMVHMEDIYVVLPCSSCAAFAAPFVIGIVVEIEILYYSVSNSKTWNFLLVVNICKCIEGRI